MAGAAVASRSVLSLHTAAAQRPGSRQADHAAQAAFTSFSSHGHRHADASSAAQHFGEVRKFRGRRSLINQKRKGSSVCRAAAAGAGPGTGSVLTPELRTAVEEFLQEHKVVLFMKGNRQFPQCGFSNTCIQILNFMQTPYETVDILENETLRSGMKEYSAWPTFPQLYIDGEFVGGCDIAIELYQSGELKELVEKALVS